MTAGAAAAPQDEPYSCGYQGYEFGAGCYPDSICIDGYLWDADSYDDGLYTQGGEMPCPRCHPKYHARGATASPSVQP